MRWRPLGLNTQERASMRIEDLLSDDEKESLDKAARDNRRAATKYGSLVERDDADEESA